MDEYNIITDSASDISYEDEKQYNITILPFKLAIGTKSYISRIDFDNEKFYKLLEESPTIPSTSQLTPYEFEELYDNQYKQGYKEIIMVLINSQGSSTFSNAKIAKDAFFGAHPEAKDFKIHLFDGASYSLGYGSVVVEAAKMLQDKLPINEVLKHIEYRLSHSVVYFGMYTLKYAAKSGRIPSAAAFVGEALNLKPIMKIYDHRIVTAAKAHGDKKLLTGIIEKTKNEIDKKYPYYIVYGSDIEVANIIKERLENELGYEASGMYQIGAAVAINAGPKVIGIGFTKID